MKVVYYKDGVGIYCFCFVVDNDDLVENYFGEWFCGDFVSYNGFLDGIRDILEVVDWGGFNFVFKDDLFLGNIESLRLDGIEFDIEMDEGLLGDF